MQFLAILATISLAVAAPVEQSLSKRAPSGTGDMTYYNPGLGSCGITNNDNDMIVAMNAATMQAQGVANPNNNPLCNKKITIKYGGKTVTAKVTDTCPSVGCNAGSIDVSPAVFKSFADLGKGRLHGVSWSM